MNIADKLLVWIASFIIFALLMFASYKISYKLGIKKALYRTTYIILSVIFAFVLAPLINNELFKLDLSKINVTLYFKDKSFSTLIDYVEEVIVHSDFLNDLYVYVPSLKDLFMDFPQVLLVPLTYVLLFILFLIIWLPLYLYLSYKRKRRVLYNRVDNKSHRVWAGVLGCVQAIFVVSLILSPINGVSRIYKNSTNNTLKGKNSSLCDQHEKLEKYVFYCRILETYNSTIFADIGGNKSISDYTFDKLTRITYDDGYTSLAKEATLIIKSAVVLSQSGLIDSFLQNDETLPLSSLVENNLTDADIEILVQTVSESKYSDKALKELESLTMNTLKDLLGSVINYDNFELVTLSNKEDAINEVKVVLKALTVLGNSTLLDDFVKVGKEIKYYTEEFPENRKNDVTTFAFIIRLMDLVDLDDFEMFFEYLCESRIFNQIIPVLIDSFFKQYGFNFVPTEGDVLDQFYNFMDVFRLFKKYKPVDAFELVRVLNDEELMLVAEILEYVIYSPDTRGFMKYLLSMILKDFDTYFYSEIFSIKNWSKEIYTLKKLLPIAEKLKNQENVSVGEIRYLLADSDSEIVQIIKRMAIQNADFFLKEAVLNAMK